MKKIFFSVIFTLLLLPTSAQDRIPILTLGTFQFNFPNLDRVQVTEENQIDILELKYQEEIDELVMLLGKFKPTIIAIERQP